MGVNLNELAKNCLMVARKREENGANIKTDTMSMLKHCAGEVVEATEAFSTVTDETSRKAFSSELADIICCVLIIAGHEEIDIAEALSSCMTKNAKRAYGEGDKLWLE